MAALKMSDPCCPSVACHSRPRPRIRESGGRVTRSDRPGRPAVSYPAPTARAPPPRADPFRRPPYRHLATPPRRRSARPHGPDACPRRRVAEAGCGRAPHWAWAGRSWPPSWPWAERGGGPGRCRAWAATCPPRPVELAMDRRAGHLVDPSQQSCPSVHGRRSRRRRPGGPVLAPARSLEQPVRQERDDEDAARASNPAHGVSGIGPPHEWSGLWARRRSPPAPSHQSRPIQRNSQTLIASSPRARTRSTSSPMREVSTQKSGHGPSPCLAPRSTRRLPWRLAGDASPLAGPLALV